MLHTYAEAQRRLRIHEGGNVDDARDPGGRTGRGVTQTTWNAFRKKHPNENLPADVFQASQVQIDRCMKELFWDVLRCDDLPAGIDYAVFDYAVNSGPGRAGRVLRRVLGLPDDDWRATDKVIGRARAVDDNAAAAAICDERIAFLQTLAHWKTYKNGWSTRVAEVRASAIAMAAANDNVRPSPKPAAVAGAPVWLVRMNNILGLYEWPGNKDNPAVIGMAQACGGKIAKAYTHDAIHWCALTVNYCLIASGLPGNDSLWALDFSKYGARLSGPAVGAIATMKRSSGGKVVGGHVYLVVGKTRDGKIVGRGGNQSDMVCDQVFEPGTVVAYTWPANYAEPAAVGLASLPVVTPAPKARRDLKLPPPTPLRADESGKGEVPANAKALATAQAGNGTVGAGVTEQVVEQGASQGLEWWTIALMAVAAIAVFAVIAWGIWYALRWWRERKQLVAVPVTVVSEAAEPSELARLIKAGEAAPRREPRPRAGSARRARSKTARPRARAAAKQSSKRRPASRRRAAKGA